MNHFGIQRLPRQFGFAIILSLVCSLWLPLSAQIIIRDTVVISPGEIIGPAAPMGEATFVAIDCGRAKWQIHSSQIPRTVDTSFGGTRGRMHLRADAWGYDNILVQCFPCVVGWCHFPTGWYWTEIGPLGPGTVVTLSTSDCQWADSTLQLVATSDTTWDVLFNSRPAGTVYFHRGSGGLPITPTVRFQQPASNAIYPTYPGHNDSTTRKNWVDLEVNVTHNGCALANYSVVVQRAVLADSGGHSHGACPVHS